MENVLYNWMQHHLQPLELELGLDCNPIGGGAIGAVLASFPFSLYAWNGMDRSLTISIYFSL